MSLIVRPYCPAEALTWDAFCDVAIQSTFLHKRRFLSYHGNRFVDRSLIIESDGKCVGLFPSAIDVDDEKWIVSHPGITYGGVLHKGGLRGERMVDAMEAICRYYREQGYRRLTYKVVPFFYHRAPAQDDLYALFRLHAVRTRCDLSCTIDLKHRLEVSDRRRRGLKKSNKSGVEVVDGLNHLPELWSVLCKNLRVKHEARPVHTLEEITELGNRFPDHIRCVCAQLDGQLVGGTILFINPTSYHAQYIAANEMGYRCAALDYLFEHLIEVASRQGKRWFDFGISNENQGMKLNEGLYRFKSEFGGGGTVHEFYELDLERGN